MVGTGYRDAAETSMEGFVYSDRFGFKSLNDMIDPASGWNLATTFAINSSGDVVGWGFSAAALALTAFTYQSA